MVPGVKKYKQWWILCNAVGTVNKGFDLLTAQHEQQHTKPKEVKGTISKEKAYLLGDKK